ncbi:hypothetical protein ANCCEY_07763 [Ancylostoma ceylanicum]|uniref:Hexosyltransferase n=1 Tax=Ancylostoma ceylanicum TaxID=53326 RepID=A0A0D6LZT7_9BILA|nr:hypothetical protein ANCCEY_07763 [Ancylostoma ceylanicum]
MERHVDLLGSYCWMFDLRNLSQNDLQPVLLTPRSHVRKKLMVGIPVAKRSKDYTVATLSSLFAELDDNYREDIVFLVMFATTEEQFIQNRTKEMEERFSDEISTGILEFEIFGKTGLPPEMVILDTVQCD